MSVRFLAVVAATSGLLALGTASAAPSTTPQQPSAKLCTNPNFSTPEIAGCMEKASDAADQALNAAYKKAMATIDADGDHGADAKAKWRNQLATAQRAWIAFRDADCGDLTLTEWNNGSGGGPAIYACLYDKSVQRTDDLLSRYPLH